MMRLLQLLPFLRRTPDPQAACFEEALALYEQGEAIADILARYPAEDQAWLRPMLSTGQILHSALQEEEASYYFEGSLKAKVLAAARPVIGQVEEPPAPMPEPGRFSRFGAAVASVAVLAVAGMLGVISLGFITAGDSVPGEWNYGFKRASEQVQVRFASGDERINVHIRQAQERIDEIQTLVSRGDLSQGHINSFTEELDDIREIAEEEPLDSLQQAKVRTLGETAEAVLSETEEDLAPAAEEAIDHAYAVAAAVGGGSARPLDETPPDGAAASDPEPADEPSVADEPGEEPAGEEPAAVSEEPAADPDDGGAVATAGDGGQASPGEGDASDDGPPEPVEPGEGTVTTGVDGDPEPLTDPDESDDETDEDEDVADAETGTEPAPDPEN